MAIRLSSWREVKGTSDQGQMVEAQMTATSGQGGGHQNVNGWPWTLHETYAGPEPSAICENSGVEVEFPYDGVNKLHSKQ